MIKLEEILFKKHALLICHLKNVSYMKSDMSFLYNKLDKYFSPQFKEKLRLFKIIVYIVVIRTSK
jgi:hypothetical protein